MNIKKKSPQIINLLLVDDHQIMNEGLASLLAIEPDIKVIGTATDGKMALEILAQGKQIDIVLTDIEMEDIDGPSLIKKLERYYPNIKVVVSSAHANYENIRLISKKNVYGYSVKNDGKYDLLKAIRQASEGMQYLSPTAQTNFFAHKMKKEALEEKKQHSKLTSRELEVLKMFSTGLNRNVIADKLGISVGTVETHRKRIIVKLDVNNIVEAVSVAKDMALLKN